MEKYDMLRSCSSQQISFVKFYNKSDDVVLLEWIDFNGRRRQLPDINILKPGCQVSVKTYVGHPWMACLQKFRHNMVFSHNSDFVFFPSPSLMNDGSPSQHIVNIHTPMRSLELLCLLMLHKHLEHVSEIDNLNISASMKIRLRKLFDIQQNPHLPVKMIELE